MASWFVVMLQRLHTRAAVLRAFYFVVTVRLPL